LAKKIRAHFQMIICYSTCLKGELILAFFVNFSTFPADAQDPKSSNNHQRSSRDQHYQRHWRRSVCVCVMMKKEVSALVWSTPEDRDQVSKHTHTHTHTYLMSGAVPAHVWQCVLMTRCVVRLMN